MDDEARNDEHENGQQGNAKLPYILINVENLLLTEEHEQVLRRLFKESPLVVVKKQYTEGFGGCHVLEVQPHVTSNDNVSRPQLPVVVKLGPAFLSSQEVSAYHNHIKGFLPLSIPIVSEHVPDDDWQWGGIRYHLAGEGLFEFKSLADYSQTIAQDEIESLYGKQLLRAVGELHKGNTRMGALQIRSGYDRILDVNLTIQARDISNTEPLELTAEHVRAKVINQVNAPELVGIGAIRLRNFVVTKLELEEQAVILNLDLHGSHERPPSSFRVRVEALNDLTEFAIGKRIEQIDGIVVGHRLTALQQKVSKLFKCNLFEGQLLLQLEEGTQLPNPVHVLNEYLAYSIGNAPVGNIHGDLNLHNILIGLENHTLNIIDFATARIDHLFHDYLRLETDILLKIVAPILQQATVSERTFRHHRMILQLFQSLHQQFGEGEQHPPDNAQLDPLLAKPFEMLATIRKAVKKHFVADNDWITYYKCLVIYLLGSLKYPTLDEQAQQLVIIGAASLVQLIKESTVEESQGKVSSYQGRIVAETVVKALQDPKRYQSRNHQTRVDGVAIIIVTPAETTTVTYLSAGGLNQNVAYLSTESSGEKLLMADDGRHPNATKIEVTEQWPNQEPWPSPNHRWLAEPIPWQQLLIDEEGGAAIVEQWPHLLSVWGIEHTVILERNGAPFIEQTLVLVLQERMSKENPHG